MQRPSRSYWTYSAGMLVAWAVALVVNAAIGGRRRLDKALMVFAGFGICWVSETIARYVYPPPSKWSVRR